MNLRLENTNADVILDNVMLTGEEFWWFIDNEDEPILALEFCREFIPPISVTTLTLDAAIECYHAMLEQGWVVDRISDSWKEVLKKKNEK
jgi:hypothetical protein